MDIVLLVLRYKILLGFHCLYLYSEVISLIFKEVVRISSVFLKYVGSLKPQNLYSYQIMENF